VDAVLVEASKTGKVLLINTSLRLNSLVTEQRQFNGFFNCCTYETICFIHFIYNQHRLFCLVQFFNVHVKLACSLAEEVVNLVKEFLKVASSDDS